MKTQTLWRLIIVSLWAGSALASRPGDFRVIGPGGGGAMFHPAVSPHDENTVLVSCDMTGAYITHDGGRSWRMFNLRGTVKFFVFDPLDPNTIYAQVAGLWRTSDRGETWRLVYPKPSTISGIRMDSDHADETIVANPDPLGRITALAIDPADSRILYAAGGARAHPSLFVSRDRGESWKLERALQELPLRIWVASHQTGANTRLYLINPHSVAVVSGDGIESFPAPGAAPIIDTSLGFADDGQPLIFAVIGKKGYSSHDVGKTWRECVLPGSSVRIRAVAASLKKGRAAYLSYNDLELDGRKWMGVAKTEDGGETWKLVWRESDRAAANVHDAWITPTFGPDWGENPLMLGVAEQNPELCYATDLGRTMRTSDGGNTWTALYSRRAPDGGWQTTGLDVTTSYGVHFDPFDPKRQFITYTDIGLFRSEDGGNSWASSIQGIPREWWNTTYWVEFDPAVRGRMWSVNSYTHDLPRPKMWRHTAPSSYRGGICRSDNGGRTWIKSNDGMPEAAVTHILLDPASPREHRVLYAAAFGRGVYKSIDGGSNWSLKNNGITQAEPFAWRLTRAGDGTMYVIVARRSDDGSIGKAGDGALFKSTDGAESWHAVPLPEGVNGPNGLSVDSRSPARLYLAAWARTPGVHGEGGGIYVSNDAGQSWHNVLVRDQHVYDVTIDPKQPDTLYAAGFESSAWRSTDRGEHWSRIAGFNFKWGHRVIPDPSDPGSVYITTFGGSVWHGRANAEPQTLDIATPELQAPE